MRVVSFFSSMLIDWKHPFLFVIPKRRKKNMLQEFFAHANLSSLVCLSSAFPPILIIVIIYLIVLKLKNRIISYFEAWQFIISYIYHYSCSCILIQQRKEKRKWNLKWLHFAQNDSQMANPNDEWYCNKLKKTNNIFANEINEKIAS